MRRTRDLLGVALLIQSANVPADGFVYSLDDSFNLSSRTSYTERWMYGSNKGPFGASQGPSYVQTDINVTVIPLGKPSSTLNAKVMFYRSMKLVYDMELNVNICPESPIASSSFTDMEILSFEMASVAGGGDGDHSYQADVVAKHDVDESGLQHVFIQVCPSNVAVRMLLVEGEITFHNPYGYLPGMYYGCLPFELLRVLASLALGVFFGLLMWHHRTTVLPVHKMVIAVVVLGAFEALSWLVAYTFMNTTGKPSCCPYPGTVILAMTMMVLRQTVSRFLLLVICLGYGITRVRLEKREIMFIVVLTIAFLASGILQLASSVSSASHVHNGKRFTDMDPMLEIPALVTDMVYIVWIYGTLANMIKELKELNETYKLKMYRTLAWTLGTFVTLFTLLTVAMLTAEGRLSLIHI